LNKTIAIAHFFANIVLKGDGMKKILIVDDELSFLNAQKRLLLSCVECEVDIQSDSRQVVNDLYRVDYDLICWIS